MHDLYMTMLHLIIVLQHQIKQIGCTCLFFDKTSVHLAAAGYFTHQYGLFLLSNRMLHDSASWTVHDSEDHTHTAVDHGRIRLTMQVSSRISIAMISTIYSRITVQLVKTLTQMLARLVHRSVAKLSGNLQPPLRRSAWHTNRVSLLPVSPCTG